LNLIEAESGPSGQTSISASQTPMVAFNTSSSIGGFGSSWAMQDTVKPNASTMGRKNLVSMF
jgi:hypothetical protein